MGEGGFDAGISVLEVQKRPESAGRYVTINGNEGVPYPIKENITRSIGDIDELEKYFESDNTQKPEHLEQVPDAIYSSAQAEFVPLAQVVGGADAARYNGTFLVYPKGEGPSDRGRNRVWEICQSYSGGRDLDPNKPQEYYEHGGKYYVTSGRHSTAALKALGVSQIPALVTHVN